MCKHGASFISALRLMTCASAVVLNLTLPTNASTGGLRKMILAPLDPNNKIIETLVGAPPDLRASDAASKFRMALDFGFVLVQRVDRAKNGLFDTYVWSAAASHVHPFSASCSDNIVAISPERLYIQLHLNCDAQGYFALEKFSEGLRVARRLYMPFH